MITRIREVRRAKGMTLDDVAKRCEPMTTAQTIGRLETGTRTVSIGWLNRIAQALGVTAADLVDLPGKEHIPVAAYLGADGAYAPARPSHFVAPLIDGEMVGLRIMASIGDYRAGDEIWCRRIDGDWTTALNRDILVPRPAGRFFFARLLNVDGAVRLAAAIRNDMYRRVVTDGGTIPAGESLLWWSGATLPAPSSVINGETVPWGRLVFAGGNRIVTGEALFKQWQPWYDPRIQWVRKSVKKLTVRYWPNTGNTYPMAVMSAAAPNMTLMTPGVVSMVELAALWLKSIETSGSSV